MIVEEGTIFVERSSIHSYVIIGTLELTQSNVSSVGSVEMFVGNLTLRSDNLVSKTDIYVINSFNIQNLTQVNSSAITIGYNCQGFMDSATIDMFDSDIYHYGNMSGIGSIHHGNILMFGFVMASPDYNVINSTFDDLSIFNSTLYFNKPDVLTNSYAIPSPPTQYQIVTIEYINRFDRKFHYNYLRSFNVTAGKINSIGSQTYIHQDATITDYYGSDQSTLYLDGINVKAKLYLENSLIFCNATWRCILNLVESSAIIFSTIYSSEIIITENSVAVINSMISEDSTIFNYGSALLQNYITFRRSTIDMNRFVNYKLIQNLNATTIIGNSQAQFENYNTIDLHDGITFDSINFLACNNSVIVVNYQVPQQAIKFSNTSFNSFNLDGKIRINFTPLTTFQLFYFEIVISPEQIYGNIDYYCEYYATKKKRDVNQFTDFVFCLDNSTNRIIGSIYNINQVPPGCNPNKTTPNAPLSICPISGIAPTSTPTATPTTTPTPTPTPLPTPTQIITYINIIINFSAVNIDFQVIINQLSVVLGLPVSSITYKINPIGQGREYTNSVTFIVASTSGPTTTSALSSDLLAQIVEKKSSIENILRQSLGGGYSYQISTKESSGDVTVISRSSSFDYSFLKCFIVLLVLFI
eukprot:TRINITY_DN4757_c0_g1_i2.p1 TRINITY_DN4757_c0_g1~~TRINITY_DN4757_c0_g1_i2.p1  ORF type:complete len:641 (+),score=87.62 TRINITY_DN4757_c0_g1_i2:498-2420(+)